MSSKHRITPVSGKSGYIDSGGLNSYQDIVTKRTQQDMINEGKGFKRSVYKTPWGAGADYQGMEFIGSPMSFQPIDILLNINPDGIPDNFIIPTIEGEEGEKEPCDCLDCLSVSAILSEVCCDGASKVPVGFFVIGKPRISIPVDSTYGDEIQISHSQTLPIPSNCKEDSKPCYTNFYTIWIDCSGSWTERQATLRLCGKSTTIEIKKTCGGCSALTIVDADGSSATDTILTTGSNSYAYTGRCIGSVTWSVAATAGSTLGSAAITSGGVLTAVGACGTLVITATCSECGSSVTQDVRVTNSGSWVNIYVCDECHGCGPHCVGPLEFIAGRYRDTIDTGEQNPTTSCTRYVVLCNSCPGSTCHQWNSRDEWQCP